jgi:hypothetical protein
MIYLFQSYCFGLTALRKRELFVAFAMKLHMAQVFKIYADDFSKPFADADGGIFIFYGGLTPVSLKYF